MNIRTNEAGYVTRQDFLDLGFKIFDTIDVNDMGQCSYSMPQWVKDKIEITGGYWSYKIINKANSKYKTDIWWNTKDELEETLKEIT